MFKRKRTITTKFKIFNQQIKLQKSKKKNKMCTKVGRNFTFLYKKCIKQKHLLRILFLETTA